MKDIFDFIIFFYDYILRRLFFFGNHFERRKKHFVSFLTMKRGKYANSFLNTSFILLVASFVVLWPMITEAFSSNNDIAVTTSTTRIGDNGDEKDIATRFSDKPRNKVEDYSVVEGDTLSSIAQKFNITDATIRWENDISGDDIKPGQILKIPPVTGIVHKVASGENIYTIASKYDANAQEIVSFPFNEFVDVDKFTLSTGQIVYVPNGSPPEDRKKKPKEPLYPQIDQSNAKSDFLWPTRGIITQGASWYHMAVDIAANDSPPVVATSDGVVTFSGCIGYGYGCHVIVDHGNGYSTLYGHMLPNLSVVSGQSVGKGQQVGLMGSTGNSTGPHLHFEIRLGGVCQNPFSYYN